MNGKAKTTSKVNQKGTTDDKLSNRMGTTGKNEKDSRHVRGSKEADSKLSHDEGGATSKKSGTFDEATGAINRETVVFGEKQNKKTGAVEKKRGYGFTPEEDAHPFLKPQISIVSGSTGSGKTIVALNILEEALSHTDPDRLGKVMVYTGSPSDPAIQELDDDLIKIYGPDAVTSLIDDLHTIQLETRGIPEEQRKLSFLVLDDAGSSKTLSPTQIKGSEIGEILVSHRHLSLHIILPVQRVKGMLSPFVLANFSHLFLFPCKNKQDEDEVLRNIPFPEDLVKKHMSTIRSQKNQFLWFDIPHKTVKVGWNDVVLG